MSEHPSYTPKPSVSASAVPSSPWQKQQQQELAPARAGDLMEQLHPDQLLRVVQRLDSRSLAHVASASRRLCDAAVAARSSIRIAHLGARSEAKLQLASLQTYLRHHGSHVTSLSLAQCMTKVTDLPGCAQLRELSLAFSLDVQLGPSTQPGPEPQHHPGILQGLNAAALTKLSIHCHTADSPAALSVLTGLQHLEYGVCQRLPGSVLASLRQLTYLCASEQLCVGTSMLAALPSLTGLQELRLLLDHHRPPAAAAYPGLQELRQLRVLHLDGSRLAINNNLPFFAQLSAGLQVLKLRGCSSFDPAILASFPHLVALDLSGIRHGSTAGLLAQLRHQHTLTSLKLELDGSADPGAYAALTASSSQLRELEVAWRWRPPTGEVWDSIFPDSRPLPHLTSLTLAEEGWRADDFPPLQLTRLAACCAGLERLSLTRWSDSWVPDLAPLTALTALSSLKVSDCSMPTPVWAGAAQLTRLQDLELFTRDRSVDPGCLQLLTALQQLTRLCVFLPGGFNGTWLMFTNEAGEDEPPDVAQQLAEWIGDEI